MASMVSPDAMSIFSTESTTTATTATMDEGPPIMTFTSIKALFEAINNARGDALVVNQVSLQAFRELCAARDAENRKFRFSLYTTDSGVLIITIPTLYHERAHRRLERIMNLKIDAMGLDEDWSCGGGGTYTQASGNSLVASGEGDSTGLPSSTRSPSDGWPTFVIECGYSQTIALLIAKAHWWFTASNYEVKIVLLLKLNKSKESIHIEKWKASTTSTRLGATMTRAAAALYPRCFQIIDIKRDPDISNTHPNRLSRARYVVHSGPLRLEFADLFLRPPTPGTAEGDIIINDRDLQLLALKAWEPQA
ncbi:dead deah box dna helicase [Trichoderma arundinaceum]|uniref:Dead deah box dna helicase n=1 Tax=Trichoderma arundinaceum TaxID=490622 RepID=A0A395N9F3_TRIAR|nr:dead deah box dna helicase [Trichoderma arundinaceum]